MSCNGGGKSTSWHDLKDIPVKKDTGDEDFAGVEESRAVIDAIIEQEVKEALRPTALLWGGSAREVHL